MPDDNDYLVTYGFGYAKYNHTSLNIQQELNVFIPKEDSVKINILTLKNLNSKKKILKLVYYIKPVLGEDEISSNGNIELDYKNNSNTIILKNRIDDNEKYCFISCSEKIHSYTGNRDFFCGNGNISNPEALKKVKLDEKNSLGINNIVAIQMEIELEAFENKDISIMFGMEKDVISCLDLAYQYSNISKCKNELDNIKTYWNNFLGNIQVNTPIESFNIMLNGWLAYQSLVCRMWARSGFYQSGGAFGFRDQLQDTLGLKYYDINIMKKQIIKHASHQFLEGDVQHWWHDETNRGIRTRFTDDLLWLVYIVNEYISFTGDYSVLDEDIYYKEGNMLEDNNDEYYDVYENSVIKEKLYMHCIRAIEKTIGNFGEHGLPKIGSGDWNDGMNKVGNKGKGESIWLGFFFYDVLNKFIPIMEKYEKNIKSNELQQEVIDKLNDFTIKRYKETLEKLKKSLNTEGWDGRWYKRAYTDDGNELGSLKNEECKIDSISQSWSIMSEAGDNDKKYICLDSLENHLVDRDNNIIKLLDPPFEKSKLEPGYIKAYLPGTRENGGQYTHGAIWAIIAEAMLGFGNKAVELYKMINPIEHSKTKDAIQKYKVEPYVIAADVYSYKNLTGRGGWTWYTGSSSWFLKTGIENILGLKIEDKMLSIKPCIDSSWKEYSIRYKYGNSIYNITVKNPNGKNTEISKFVINGLEIKDKKIKLQDDGKIYDVEVIM